MSAINMGRVVLGGLLAGLVIDIGEFLGNSFVFADAFAESMTAHNIAEPGGSAIAIFMVLGFVGGIAMVWLYAAIRPRLGPGPKTAAVAGVVAWLFWYLFPSIGWMVMGVYPTSAMSILALVWGLAEFVLAAVAGAWLYVEGAGQAAGVPTGGMRPPM
jgi:hypothetical protein